MRNAFVSVGFQVVTVSKNGKKLWETIRNERPDAVICNVFMPHYDVISIMEKLRGEKDINFPVFAILSSFDQDFFTRKIFGCRRKGSISSANRSGYGRTENTQGTSGSVWAHLYC